VDSKVVDREGYEKRVFWSAEKDVGEALFRVAKIRKDRRESLKKTLMKKMPRMTLNRSQ